jgi:D-arabinitol dehydrogenase (NADP+)
VTVLFANICIREFIAKFPLIPGHETVGVVAAMGKDVKGFEIGERVVADNSELCNECCKLLLPPC